MSQKKYKPIFVDKDGWIKNEVFLTQHILDHVKFNYQRDKHLIVYKSQQKNNNNNNNDNNIKQDMKFENENDNKNNNNNNSNYNQFGYQHKGRINTILITNARLLAFGVKKLLETDVRFLGFDVEWRANFIKGKKRNKISLIQIGNNKVILLIRIHLLKYIPNELINLLQNNNILKFGVGIYDDQNKLKNDYNINMCGAIDLKYIFNKYNNTHQPIGLKKMCLIVLKKPMKYKNKSITLSNWEIANLSIDQVRYACDDCYIGYKIAKKIINKFFKNKVDIFIKDNTHLMDLIDNDNYKKKGKKKMKAPLLTDPIVDEW